MVIAEVFMPFMWVFSTIDVSTQVEPMFTCKEQIITTSTPLLKKTLL
jgi:hypothetical protein